ncbi:MAG: hypothetical protein QG591_924 [Planctomycetota bacterium]|nr:hypothetical protein [Planctomycetota bacterium]
MIDKLNQIITEKSEKIMSNEKVEGFVNNLGGVFCFVGAVVFGIMFIVGSASLMRTGKNYVVKPSAEEKKEAEATSEPAAAAEEETLTTEHSAE